MTRSWLIGWLAGALVMAGCIQRSYAPTPTKTPMGPRTPVPTAAPTTPAPTPVLDTPVPTVSTPPATSTLPRPSTPGTPTDTSVPPTIDPGLPPDHYLFIRPLPKGYVDYPDRTYAYGATQGGQREPHSGDDFLNPESTPVVAVANATVYYAGPDSTQLFGPEPNYYGNVIVLQITGATYAGKQVYALYGHLSRILVQNGQQVAVGDVIGEVGSTGIAIGPHLHLEVRVGDPTSFTSSTRNPELWLKPYYGYGTLAGKVVDGSGAYLRGVALTVKGTDTTRYVWTYEGDVNIPDENWKENFVLGDLPEGWYTVTTRGGSKLFSQDVYIHRGHTTWLTVELP